MNTMDFDRMVETAAIRELVCHYCRAVDRLDMEALRACYHPEGVDHHTGFDGSIDEYIPWVEKMLRMIAGSMHIVGNHLVEFGENPMRALSETYGTAIHWGRPEDSADLNYTSAFRYLDLVEKRDGRWRILERYAVRELAFAITQVPRQVPGPSGRRDDKDPLYALRGRLLEG